MSELTAYNSERIYWAVEQVERDAGDIDDLHLDDNLFYIKSEADKVIADKDKEIRRLQRALYKACANWAHEKDDRYYLKYVCISDDARIEYERWRNVERNCLKKAEEYK